MRTIPVHKMVDETKPLSVVPTKLPDRYAMQCDGSFVIVSSEKPQPGDIVCVWEVLHDGRYQAVIARLIRLPHLRSTRLIYEIAEPHVEVEILSEYVGAVHKVIAVQESDDGLMRLN